jgi:predicted nuclease with RNAse H fold
MNWDDFDSQQPVQQSIFPDCSESVSPLSRPRAALYSGDMAFFAQALDPKEHFRIALEVPERTLFLDIETTGLSRYYDIITLVGWSYQDRYQAFIQGEAEDSLRKALDEAQVVVTFNGSLFDLPFLRTHFTGLRIPPVHIDLRFLAKRVGLSGGQKAIEELLGFKRKGTASDIRGEAAPILWHRYRRGDMQALRLLIEYNHLDIEGMKFIFDKVVAKLVDERGVPKSIRDRIPKLAKPSKLKLVNDHSAKQAPANSIHLVPYQGPHGPSIRLPDLIPAAASASIRIVGIDLTGSEKRPTGWCLLDGNQVTTRCVRSDDDLISASMETRPHVVSIDSPLSLPRGRISVSDDDPGRDQYGIMRYCERVLKKRGINVYPALIPSMQKLTARGIRLATAFRTRGIPVIESYPGAAQDIMGIPRKRASLEMLREGLSEFGVTGEFLETQVTHDELDAITAAIVGAFFWGGRFEALGDDDEEALIIPDLSCNPHAWQTRRVIGFSGAIAAGKTTAARCLENAGFQYARYSMVVESLLRDRGEDPARHRLQEFGAEIHRNYGQRWLGKRLLEMLPPDGNLVIDGLRFPDDNAFLIEIFGPAFLHIHIEAPKDVREIRFGSRQDAGRNFAESEVHPVESHIPELRGLAHMAISNDTSLSSFQHKILSIT